MNSPPVPADQPPSTQQPFANPVEVQEPLPVDLLRSTTIVWSEDYYDGSPFYSGPVYQGMASNHQLPNQYRPPSSGPSRNQRRNGSRKAEHPYRNRIVHESFGMVIQDRSTCVNPGMTRNDAGNNPSRGMVW